MSMDQATQSFITEAVEIIDDLEGQLLSLESNPSRDAVDAVFRAMHTIKGSGAMFGYSELAGFTHHLESVFETVRGGTLEVSPALISVALKARDLMSLLLEVAGGTDEARQVVNSAEAKAVLGELETLIGSVGTEETAAENTPAKPDAPAKHQAFTIRFKPAALDLVNGMRPDLLIRELLELGEGTVSYLTDAIPALDGMDFSQARLGYLIELQGEIELSDIQEVFIFADDAELEIDVVAPSKTAEPTTGVTAGSAPAQPIEATRNGPRNKSLRVSGDRIDQIMDTIGELVISQARLNQVARKHEDSELESVVEEVERLVLALRDTTLSMRMLPIETVFAKFHRVVRDLSESLGKDVELRTRGGETEIDKNVIDRLSEPLVHMIRNSMDHGIEDPATREQADKPVRGTIFLEARQEGSEVVIEVADNGRGLDADAIRAKAERLGVISSGGNISDQEAYDLIFSAGFSTSQTVSDVSGRGVGMDAVRTAVEELRGQVITTTKLGSGTRFSLHLPLSMAIIEGLRVRLGEQVFVIPLAAVDECVELQPGEGARQSRRMLRIRNELIPYVPLEDVLGLPSDGATDKVRRVVITRSGGTRTGFVVDDVLGQAQTVIKPLSSFHQDIAGLSGATILGDGSVAMILDISVLAQASRLDVLKSAA